MPWCIDLNIKTAAECEKPPMWSYTMRNAICHKPLGPNSRLTLNLQDKKLQKIRYSVRQIQISHENITLWDRTSHTPASTADTSYMSWKRAESRLIRWGIEVDRGIEGFCVGWRHLCNIYEKSRAQDRATHWLNSKFIPSRNSGLTEVTPTGNPLPIWRLLKKSRQNMTVVAKKLFTPRMALCAGNSVRTTDTIWY
jgi:hypothetical protein